MTEAVDRGNSDTEGHRTQASALPIEGVSGGSGVRQATPADCESQGADRDVDREQEWPARNRQNCGGDRRTDSGGDSDHHRIDADAAAELRVRIGEADERRVDAHDSSRPKALKDARQREPYQRMRQRAERRSEGEQQESGKINASVADDFAERSKGQ